MQPVRVCHIPAFHPAAEALVKSIRVKNENVTKFHFALVESDTLPIAEQDIVFCKLELPIAALVHSGGKSLHAIVHIDASCYEEYRKRVEKLYDFLEKNDVSIDKQNRNPSRLSRMPGVTRNGNRQYLGMPVPSLYLRMT